MEKKVYVVVLRMDYKFKNYSRSYLLRNVDPEPILKVIVGVFTTKKKAKEAKELCIEKIRNEYSDECFYWEKENLVRDHFDLGYDWSAMGFEILIEERNLNDFDFPAIDKGK